MTLKEAIERYTSNAEYERIHGSLQGCLDFRQLAEWLKDYERLLGQEPCEDEYIKVPKMALKYRTAGMVAYNAEWLKNHFDIERAVICGAQEPCEDAISRQVVLDKIELVELKDGQSFYCISPEDIETLPSVNSQQTGHWIDLDEKSAICSCCNRNNTLYGDFCKWCGAKMVEPQEVRDKE